jgi:AcrR family transcriptional regulator
MRRANVKPRRSAGPAGVAFGGLRERLVNAALQLVERSDAGALSLRQVARHSHVSAMAPYSHFTDRLDLLSAVATAGFQELERALPAALSAPDLSPSQRLGHAGGLFVSFAERRPQLTLLMWGGAIPSR